MDLGTPANGFIITTATVIFGALAGYAATHKEDYKALKTLFINTLLLFYIAIWIFVLGAQWVWYQTSKYLTFDEEFEVLMDINFLTPDLEVLVIANIIIYAEIFFIDVCFHRLEDKESRGDD